MDITIPVHKRVHKDESDRKKHSIPFSSYSSGLVQHPTSAICPASLMDHDSSHIDAWEGLTASSPVLLQPFVVTCQQVAMLAAGRNFACSNHLREIVDSSCATVISAKSPQSCHRSVLPKESQFFSRSGFTHAYDLTAIIDAISSTAGSTQRSQVVHSAIFPEEGSTLRPITTLYETNTDDLAMFIDSAGETRASSKSSKISDRTVMP